MKKIRKTFHKHDDQAGFVILFSVSLVAFVLVLYATGQGLTLKSDSVRYIMGAENLAAGNGYIRYTGSGSVKPIAVFPPGYSMLLAALAAAGLQILTAARILNLLFFPLSVFITGWLVYRMSGRWSLSIPAALTAAGYVESLRYHSMAMSESALIFFSLLSVTLLLLFLEHQKIWLLIAAGLVIGFTPLIRYLGAALLPGAVLAVLLFYRAPRRRRIGAAAWTFAAGSILTALWFLRNAIQTGSAMNRSLAFHPPPLDKVAGYVDEVIGWFIPAVLGSDWRPRLSHLAVFVAVASLAFLYLQFKKLRTKEGVPETRFPYNTLPLISFTYVMSYTSVLIISITFLDASLGGFQRYLLPTLFFTVIIIAELAGMLLEMGQIWKVSGWIFIVLWLTSSMMHFKETRDSLWEIRNERGLSVSIELNQETARFLEELNPDVIMTNDIELVYLMLDRYAFMIPIRVNDYTDEPTSDYQEQMQAYSDKMEDGAVLVLFEKIHTQENYASYEELTAGLELIHSSLSVEVFFYPGY